MSHNIDISEKSRFNIASNAKQFTALMILELANADKLNLEDDIRKYLNKLYPKVAESIKIRHLLNHTSGVRDYVELLGLQDRIWWKQLGLDNDDVLELLTKQEELGFKPGTQYSYSNAYLQKLLRLLQRKNSPIMLKSTFRKWV